MTRIIAYIDRSQSVFMAGVALGLIMGTLIEHQKDAAAVSANHPITASKTNTGATR